MSNVSSALPHSASIAKLEELSARAQTQAEARNPSSLHGELGDSMTHDYAEVQRAKAQGRVRGFEWAQDLLEMNPKVSPVRLASELSTESTRLAEATKNIQHDHQGDSLARLWHWQEVSRFEGTVEAFAEAAEVVRAEG
jgi:hypothetical protein